MRVLFVTSMWPDEVISHYGTFVQTQAQSVEAQNVAVDVISIRGYVSQRAYIDARRPVLQAVRTGGYAVTHFHTGHAAASSLLGVPGPSLVSFVGGDLLGNPDGSGRTTRKSHIEALMFRQLSRAATETITKSLEMERVLPRSVQARNTVIPNGVNIDAFASHTRDVARASLGWPENEKVGLFLGNPLDARKNVSLARAAAAEVHGFRLHEAWGSPPREIPRLMAAADCLVFTSLSEGSPNVVKEAMAAALPIAATPVGDVPERLADVEGCVVATPCQFVDGLRRVATYGRAPAAREAVRPLSLESIAAQVIAIYRRLA